MLLGMMLSANDIYSWFTPLVEHMGVIVCYTKMLTTSIEHLYVRKNVFTYILWNIPEFINLLNSINYYVLMNT